MGQEPGDVRAKTKRQVSAYSKATRGARSGTISPRADTLQPALLSSERDRLGGAGVGESRERVVRRETGDDRARRASGAGVDRRGRPWPGRPTARRVARLDAVALFAPDSVHLDASAHSNAATGARGGSARAHPDQRANPGVPLHPDQPRPARPAWLQPL